MNKQISNIQILLLGLFVVMGYSCAGTGSITRGDQSQVYAQSFEKMVQVVERAVKAGSLSINHAFKDEDEAKVTLIVVTNAFFNDQQVQKEQGEVIITELENGKIRVEVNNPEYHFTVPTYQREKYDRIIFNRIDSILAEKKYNN